jgi:hypothetical protein
VEEPNHLTPHGSELEAIPGRIPPSLAQENCTRPTRRTLRNSKRSRAWTSDCECGVEIPSELIEDRPAEHSIIQCTHAGCETRWVSSLL